MQITKTSMKTVRGRKKVARQKGRFIKKEAKSVFKDLITNSDFSFFYNATRFLTEKDTPKAFLSTNIDEDIGMILITNSVVLFFEKRPNEVSLKEVASFDSISKFDIFISHGEGEFSIKLEDDVSYRSSRLPARLLKKLNTQVTKLGAKIKEIEKSRKNNIEDNDEDIKKTSGESKNKSESMDGEDMGKKKILEKLSDIEDKLGEKKKWEHRIVTGPVLSGEGKLRSKLDRLGKLGWELVDTQRHSIMGSQHAVCFLKRRKDRNSDL